MTARQEVEEILEQQLWAERNNLDLRPSGAYLPPAEMLRRHELKAHRDCPAPDAWDTLPIVPLGWTLAIWLLFLLAVVLIAWALHR